MVSQSDSLVRVSGYRHHRAPTDQKDGSADGHAGGDETMRALAGGDDEIYDLSTLELADKQRTIQKILRYHPNAP